MATTANVKPRFCIDQMTSATEAAKRFSEVRRRAKREPQFITDRNTVDSVIVSYDEYEAMYAELCELRERAFLADAAARIATCDADPAHKCIDICEVLDEDEYAELLAIDPDCICDEDLFE